MNPHYPELIYRTGDLGKYNEFGEVLFLSRKDSQIKHRGRRIELGEVEIAANALCMIDAACCFYDGKNEKIVLCYQAAQKCDKDIIIAIREFLPNYMVPNILMHFEELPLNKNSKIDRALLKNQTFEG